MRTSQKPGFLETVRAALSVAGAIESRRRPNIADLRTLGIRDDFADNGYFGGRKQ